MKSSGFLLTSFSVLYWPLFGYILLFYRLNSYYTHTVLCSFNFSENQT